MKKKIFPFILILIFFIIFFIFYKGLQNSNIYKPEIKSNKVIPSFKAKLFNNEDLIYSEEIFNENKFYLVNIWASWCIPCRNEHSFLMELSKKKNIQIIGLNYKDNNDSAVNFLKELGDPYQLIFLDKDGTLAIEWGAYGVPESFLVYNKKIIKKIIGPLNSNLFENIKELIK